LVNFNPLATTLADPTPLPNQGWVAEERWFDAQDVKARYILRWITGFQDEHIEHSDMSSRARVSDALSQVAALVSCRFSPIAHSCTKESHDHGPNRELTLSGPFREISQISAGTHDHLGPLQHRGNHDRHIFIAHDRTGVFPG
jgi:hypothetical protein